MTRPAPQLPTLRLAVVADDFTGSTDVMETLTWGGVPCALFLEPPDDYGLLAFPHSQAVVWATTARTMSPAQMDDYLPNKVDDLVALGAPLLHYKICSTFDSAPHIGSIGHASELLLAALERAGAAPPASVPVVVGAPRLKRYVAFGNLFATVDGRTYRLDRHPVMPRHPVTPMHEADLRLHLAQQTRRPVAGLDVLALDAGPEAARAALGAVTGAAPAGPHAPFVIYDTTSAQHLATIGALLSDAPALSLLVGSSGVEAALLAHWHATGSATPAPPPPSAGEVAQLVVVSGSASPVTAGQLAWAREHGYAMIRVDAPAFVDPTTAEAATAAALEAGKQALGDGRSVVLYAADGPDDPAIAEAYDRHARIPDPRWAAYRPADLIGARQGIITRGLLHATGLRRVAVCGGDTSGAVVRRMGIFALEALAPVAPGAPLCRATAHDLATHGLELALKAGQVGPPDYFERVRRGGGAA